MNRGVGRPIVCHEMAALYRWLTHNWIDGGDARLPVEAVFLRGLGLAYLAVFLVDTFTTSPTPALHGRGLVVLAATIAFVAAAVGTQTPNPHVSTRRRIAMLLCVTASAAVLGAVQHDGFWAGGPYFVAIVAGMRLERRAGAVTLLLSIAVLLAVSLVAGHPGDSLVVLIGAVPWYLVMRLMRETRNQRDALAASQAAQAQSAAAAERGRLAREMHDVLAHSLSALALQLESTRLLARERGVDEDVARAIDRAHHLTASGLRDVRRAIATARGDELPGPERLPVLAEAFQEQSGLPVAVQVRGEPHELAPDARLAVYRTAQEALTNVQRHAAAERVEIALDYLPRGTLLVIEDRAPAGTPPPVAIAGDGGYGLTGMRERAALLGGELRAEPTAEGFRVELRLPA